MKYFDALLQHLRLTAGFDQARLADAEADLGALETKVDRIEQLDARLTALEDLARQARLAGPEEAPAPPRAGVGPGRQPGHPPAVAVPAQGEASGDDRRS